MKYWLWTPVYCEKSGKYAKVIGEGNNEWTTKVRYRDGTVAIVEDDTINDCEEDTIANEELFDESINDEMRGYCDAPKTKTNPMKHLKHIAVAVAVVSVAVFAAKYSLPEPKKDCDSVKSCTARLNWLNDRSVPDYESRTEQFDKIAKANAEIAAINARINTRKIEASSITQKLGTFQSVPK